MKLSDICRGFSWFPFQCVVRNSEVFARRKTIVAIICILKAFTVIDGRAAGVYSSYESTGINLEYFMEEDGTIYSHYLPLWSNKLFPP